MSIDATIATWKLPKTQITAIQKLILLSLADRAGESAECWPSIKRLVCDTNLDRKTIIDNRQILIDKKLIKYTGEMKGRTKLIPVMRLTYVLHREGNINLETEENFNSTENGTVTNLNSTDTGIVKQYRKRDTESKMLEPTITTSSSSIFEQYKTQELQQLQESSDAIDNEKRIFGFKQEALNDEKCLITFKQRFSGLDVTLEELYDECRAYWSQKNQLVYKQRFLTHLKKAPLSNYEHVKTVLNASKVNNDEFNRIQLEESERKRKEFLDRALKKQAASKQEVKNASTHVRNKFKGALQGLAKR